MDTNRTAHLDDDATALVVEHLTVRDKDVVREAQRWTTGERGPVVDDAEVLADADLTEFVSEAVQIGAHALSATGQAQDARALERMLKDVGDKTADSTAKAAEATGRAVKDATETDRQGRRRRQEGHHRGRRADPQGVHRVGRRRQDRPAERSSQGARRREPGAARAAPAGARQVRRRPRRQERRPASASCSPRRPGSSTRATRRRRWPSTPPSSRRVSSS